MKRKVTLCVLSAALCLALSAGTVWADAYDDAAGGGYPNWNDAATWEVGGMPAVAYPNQSGDTAVIDERFVMVPSGYVIPNIDSVTVGGGGGSATLYMGPGANQTGVAGPGAVEILSNGRLNIRGTTTLDWTNDPVITLNGGTILTNDWEEGVVNLNDPIHVAANSTINNITNTLNLNGALTGVAGATLLFNGQRVGVYLNGDNSGFLGNIEVTNPAPSETTEGRQRLYVTEGDLGNAAAVTVKNYGMIAFTEDYTSSLPPVTAEADGWLYLRFSRSGGTTPFTGALTLDGGVLTNQGYGDYYASEMAGQLTLASDSYVNVSGEGGDQMDLYITGNVTGAGKMIVERGMQFYAGGGSSLYMGGTSTGWTGGLEVRSGTTEVISTTALGSGTVVVKGSGTLRTVIDGAFGGAPGVVAESGGVIKINSTEAITTKMILNGLGGLWIESGATPMNYSGGSQNIEVHTGAILHENIDDVTYPLPAVSEIIDDGGGQYVWTGAGTFTAVKTYTVGLGGGGSVKGLAAMSTSAAMNANVTVTEFNAGSGFSLFTPGGTFRLQGPTFNGTGSVTLEGAGNYLLHANAFAGTITTLDYVGTGYVAPATDTTVVGALGAGQTLNVHGGSAYFLWGSPEALGTGATPDTFATVNIKDGAMFYTGWERLFLTRGNIHIEDGGAMHVAADWPAGAVLSFDPGSQIVFKGLPEGAERTFTTQLPTDGNASFVFDQQGLQLGQSGVKNVVLGNNSTLMGTGWYPDLTAASGDLVLAPGATQGRVAAHWFTADNQGQLFLNNQVNIPTGTLIVGGTETFRTVSGLNQWTDYNMSGKVHLNNTSNVIEKIDVQAGLLAINEGTAAPLGGADVHIAAGATMGSSVDKTVYSDMTFSGGGLLSVLDWQGKPGNWTASMTLAGSTLSPGRDNTAGILTIDVDGWESVRGLNFATSGASNCQIVLDVVKDGGATDPPVEGVDYDRLAVLRMAGMTNADFTVRIPLPGPNFKPANLAGDTLTVMTSSMDLSALQTGVDGWASATLDTIDDANNHWVGNINYIDGGMTVSDLEWRGYPGDANLDDSCDVSDLSLLAGSYRKSGTWLQGDFNFDGNVDVSDLSLLAGNFRTSNPNPPPGAGGAPVPEPVTLVLLGLGGLGLVARRRRK